MAKFLNRISGGLYMGTAPLWGDEPVSDELFTELRAYPAQHRIEARELIRLRGEAEAAGDASDAAVEAYNSALHAHEDAMAALVAARDAAVPDPEIVAAEQAVNAVAAPLEAARAAMHAAQAAHTEAVQAVMAVSASLNSHAA